jgi:MFS family permease
VIIPIYLIQFVGVLDAAALAFLGSIITLPWVFKIFYGMLGDKFGSKKLGRRRPWIITMVSIAGFLWIILGLPGIFTTETAISVFTIMGILIFLGVSFGDTIIDGLVLDITPENKLGRVSGLNWGIRSVGAIAGGPALAALVVAGGLDVPMLFIIVGILTILSSFLTLLIKEPKVYPEVQLGKHLKEMFNNKRDWKTFAFSLFASIIDSVGILFVSIFILINMGLLSSTGTSLSLPSDDLDIYLVNGGITMVISAGVVVGAIVGGQIADRITRKLSVYIGYIITTIALLLMLIPLAWPILLAFSALVGCAIGWRHSSYAAVATEISKKHPEMDSTFYSMCNAFANIGGTLGMSLTGIFLSTTGSYLMVFLFLAVISNLGLIGFLLLDSKNYEHRDI